MNSHITPLCTHALFNFHNFATAAIKYMQVREKGHGICIGGENIFLLTAVHRISTHTEYYANLSLTK